MRKDEEITIRKMVLSGYLLNIVMNFMSNNHIAWRSLDRGPKSLKLYDMIFDRRKDTVDVRGKRLKSLARAYGMGIHIEEKEGKLLINITLDGTTTDT